MRPFPFSILTDLYDLCDNFSHFASFVVACFAILCSLCSKHFILLKCRKTFFYLWVKNYPYPWI